MNSIIKRSHGPKCSICLVFLIAILIGSPLLAAQTKPANNTSPTPTVASEPPAMPSEVEQMDQFLTDLALDHMPLEYTDEKDWGQQDERWDGIRVYRKDGKIRTKRRKKVVNHGTWKRYSASLANPEEQFSVRLDNFREVGDRTTAFDVIVSARIKIDGRQTKWIKGVQLYSISTNGKADLRLTVSVELKSTLNIAKFPPDLVLEPVVSDADIELLDFRIDRVSKVGGELTQQLTKAVRKAIDKKIVEKEQKLVAKMNAKIDANRDRLTLSAEEAMKSKWAKFVPEKDDESPKKSD